MLETSTTVGRPTDAALIQSIYNNNSSIKRSNGNIQSYLTNVLLGAIKVMYISANVLRSVIALR